MGQKIVFVTGKGGVGKSTIAASYALKYADQGHKTLLVELSQPSYFVDFWHLSKIQFHAQQLKLNLDITNWTSWECLKDYGSHLLKNESVFNLFFDTPAIKALIGVAPGLYELAILGKLTSHIRKVGPQLNYDVIVVDAFATGHFKALMNAPIGISEAVKFGPIFQQSQSIIEVLKNPDITQFKIVSLPEEMPMMETEELQTWLKSIGINSEVVINKVVSKDMTELDFQNKSTNVDVQFFEYIKQQFENEKEFLQNSYLKLPFIFDYNASAIADQLAGELNT